MPRVDIVFLRYFILGFRLREAPMRRNEAEGLG